MNINIHINNINNTKNSLFINPKPSSGHTDRFRKGAELKAGPLKPSSGKQRGLRSIVVLLESIWVSGVSICGVQVLQGAPIFGEKTRLGLRV